MPAAISIPGKTTAQNAEAAAKENAAKQQAEIEARNEERAKLNPRKESPLTVRSRQFSMRDPDTGKHLPAGEMVTLPFAGGWLRSQIAADLVEVLDGDASVPVEEAKETKPAKNAKSDKKDSSEDLPPVKLDRESDEEFAKRKAEYDAAHPAK